MTPQPTAGVAPPPHTVIAGRLRPEDHRQRWVDAIARQKALFESTDSSAFAFRLGNEALALPTSSIQEIMEKKQVHSLPHRKSGVVLGLANCRGELLTCVSLGALLGITRETPADREARGLDAQPRLKRALNPLMAVLHWRGNRLGFPVDQVLGTFRFSMASLRPAPPAVQAGLNCALGLFEWEGHLVTFLDVERLATSLYEVLS